jgi:hypothetical protein
LTKRAVISRLAALQGLSVVAVVTSTLVLAGSAGHTRGNPAAPRAGPAALKQARAAGIDTGSVIETVQHHVAPSTRDQSVLVASDRLYRAEFRRDGVTLSLRGPHFGLATVSVRRGGRALGLAPGRWKGRLNHVERNLLPGLTERVTASEGRLEWDVLLARPPPGGGDLRVVARIEAGGAPRRSRRSWRWPVGRDRLSA